MVKFGPWIKRSDTSYVRFSKEKLTYVFIWKRYLDDYWEVIVAPPSDVVVDRFHINLNVQLYKLRSTTSHYLMFIVDLILQENGYEADDLFQFPEEISNDLSD